MRIKVGFADLTMPAVLVDRVGVIGSSHSSASTSLFHVGCGACWCLYKGSPNALWLLSEEYGRGSMRLSLLMHMHELGVS